VTRNRNSGRGEDGRWHRGISNWSHIRQNRDGLRLGGAPFGFDRVIVSRFSHDGDAGSVARHVNVKVNGNGRCGMIQFFGVNMEKWRL